MYQGKSLLAALFAIIAVSATAASTAFAGAPEAPEFLNAARTGAPEKKTFTGTTKTPSTLISKADKSRITCAVTTIAGTVEGPKELLATLTFTGCKSENKKTGKICEVQSQTAGKEEIRTKVVTGKLGYISKAAKEDGLEIKPTTGSSFATLEGGCLVASPANVEGKVEPVNVASLAGSIVCAASAELQSIKLLEGGKEDTLKLFGLEAAEECTPKETFEELVETTA